MTAFIRSLVALAYLASAVTAQAGFVINSFWAAAASISFVSCTASGSDAPSYTFTDHATGTAGNRKTIVSTHSTDAATDFSISSMTVGGVSATEVVDSANAGSIVQAAIYVIDNPSGTTATIIVTPSETLTGMIVCVWAAYDLQSATATATASEFQTSSAAITLSLNVPAGGIAVGAEGHHDAGGTTGSVWTGMTERADAASGFADIFYSAADTTTGGTPLTVTADPEGTTDAIGVSASFR